MNATIDTFGFNINSDANDYDSNYDNPELTLEEAIESDYNELNSLINQLISLNEETYDIGTEAVAKDRSLVDPNTTEYSFNSDSSNDKKESNYKFNPPLAKKEGLIKKIFGILKRFFQRVLNLLKKKGFFNYTYIQFTNIKLTPGYEKYEFYGIPYQWIHEYDYSMKSMLNGIKHASNFLGDMHKVTNVNDLQQQLDDVSRELDKIHFIADPPKITKITAEEISKGCTLLRTYNLDKKPLFKYLAHDFSHIEDWFSYKALKPDAQKALNSLSNAYILKLKNIGSYLVQVRNIIIATNNALLKAVDKLLGGYAEDRRFLRAFHPADPKKANSSDFSNIFDNSYINDEMRRFRRNMHNNRKAWSKKAGLGDIDDDDDDIYTPKFK